MLRALTRRWAQEKHFDPVTAADWAETSLINASTLRYLLLDGAYLCDVPLRLPSLFVLQLGAGASIKPATNLSLDNTTTFTGLVEMSDVHFSAVVGGTVDASSLPAEAFDYPYRRGYQAVAIKGGSNNAVRHVSLRANNSDGAVGINQSPHGEIAHCDIGGGPGGQGMTKGRCVWCLATSHALVHDNHVRNCSSHSLDFDAFTSTSAAYSNLCEDGIEEGIFVEETASNNFVSSPGAHAAPAVGSSDHQMEPDGVCGADLQQHGAEERLRDRGLLQRRGARRRQQ